MRIIVNGTPRDVTGRVLSEILVECGYRHRHVATALNGEFVHQHLRQDTAVRPGDRVEIVAPNAGG
ncbi:MAG: sulfur carrier protein ThiS [Gammaproteobacteria bacterium]|nr:sulfur carrier protein ThiS [Gammaproteobacteria bacterium]MYD75360.1 sulfur carrier protein ThiS [Gammaproteobacteria bacterium]MYJ52654.1 sulfur carrier protein ThiS [Gammaproteobacteria bacterium]